MLIRDGHAKIDGDESTFEMPSGSVEIISEDGRELFSISIEDGHTIRVSCASTIRSEGRFFDNAILVAPRSSNVVLVSRA